METIIEDVLTLAREGRTIGDTDATVVERAWGNAATGGMELLCGVEGGEWTVDADDSRLEGLLENLFRNAADHGGEGVTVRVGRLSTGVYVADDGPGIPPDERERVFDYGHSTREDGTGFGLAIVRRIARAHGWTVTVESSTLGSARFEITT